jgi:hypothetical protein
MDGVSNPRHPVPFIQHRDADYLDEHTGWEKTGLQLLADIEILKATLRSSRQSTADANHRAEEYRVAMTDARGHAEAFRNSLGVAIVFPWEA